MEFMYLRGNSFDGAIPDIRKLVGVKEVDLSNNNMSESIPGYIANFSSLQYLNLSINNFEGMVPTEGKFQNSTIVLLSGNKNLCRGIKELKLKPCIVVAPLMETNQLSLLKKVVIGVSVGIAFLLLLFIVSLSWFIKRKNNQKTINSAAFTLESFHEKISYGVLRNATDGFSSSNMVGSGSFGTVFKALLPTENKVVAVKVLNLQRRVAMKDIRHRNFVKLLTACSSIDFRGNEFKALIYEFMPNGSLDMWLHQSIHGDVYSFGVLLLEMFTGKRPTNELFGGNFTLHRYTKLALLKRVLYIADKSIFHIGLRVCFCIAECLTLILEVGLKCCEESPTNRLATSEVVKELISIRERFFKASRTTQR